jgi:hypothetical protein
MFAPAGIPPDKLTSTWLSVPPPALLTAVAMTDELITADVTVSVVKDPPEGV